MFDSTAPLSQNDLLKAGEESENPSDDSSAAIEIAKQLLLRSRSLLSPAEKIQQAELDRMIGRREDKATLVAMTDQAFRTHVPARVADQLTHILDLQGVPRFFSPLDRTLLRGFQSFGSYLPGVAIPLVKEKMRRETANVILPAEPELLNEHLRQRHKEGVRMNVNFLGEALLGEGEARRRLKVYLAALADPQIECISVKISTIYSQISPLARQHTVDVVADRMELLYRAAARTKHIRPDGKETTKFVYLDMEEYRDLHLTADCLMQALDREELQQVRAGIALQAYVPDSYPVLQTLVEWAKKRVAAGGHPLTIRVVKGANLEMERVEASVAGWPQAPYLHKWETDANYKRMLKLLLQPEVANAVQTGVASHNLFDIGLAMVWANQTGVLPSVQFEMLEGMANHQRRALFEATGSMLLYAPACRQEDFLHAIGYLIRRLDENTGEDNFLRHTFQLQPDTPEWDQLVAGFLKSYEQIDQVSALPRRTQDRRQPPAQPPVAPNWESFVNEPDTDWSLPQNGEWIEGLLAKHKLLCNDMAPTVPVVVGGETIEASDSTEQAGRTLRESFDPSRPKTVSCRFLEASADDIRKAIQTAADDPDGWRKTTLSYRHERLREAAQKMRERRGDLIATAVAEGGKTVLETDPEVSEAIDFAEFYPLTAVPYQSDPNGSQPRGVIAVISPWNFPLAIPCGGIAAALAAGNTVILKPASDTVLCAYRICQAFWDAGVPRTALQFIPCQGRLAGEHLIPDPRIDSVILTGGTSTAKAMLDARPDLDLLAETGGKNATIVTAMADRDLAIKHVLHSAFSNCGQKCSATSLLLLEQEVYDDPHFRETLSDAVKSLRVGEAWDLTNKMGPLIRPPSDDLARGMKELEPGESWLVIPEHVGDNPRMYRPGVKWNVQPESFTHWTELFGPVLGVIPFRKLDEAVAIVNATGYGLTSGLESLDDREQELWRETIRAGNLYINRPTTGAIVLRQPFGGMGASAFGAGLKAGSPNYVVGLMRHPKRSADRSVEDQPTVTPELSEPISDVLPAPETFSFSEESPLESWHEALRELTSAATLSADDRESLQVAATSIRRAVAEEFGQVHDPLKLLGQDNLHRYLAVPQLRVRLQSSDRPVAALIAAMAAAEVGCRAVFSYAPDTCSETVKTLQTVMEHWAGRIELLEESDAELIQAIESGAIDRLRLLSEDYHEEAVLRACGTAFVPAIRRSISENGRIECLWFVREQSISHDYHRYGNLGARER